MTNGLNAALEAIDGVQYVTNPPGRYDLRIVLEHNSPFETIDEIRDTKPVGLELGVWGATQEHLPAIDCEWKEEL